MTSPLTHFGRYRIVSELGRGAMGVVYQAEDAALDRQVAVKTILLPQDPDERATYEARFLQEAKAAGSLNHPNIITIYDLGREGDWAFIAMELLDGKELRDLMHGSGMPVASALNIAAQVARALAAAHARNIVHRDIKPSNIMVLPGGHAKIMDFGIARMQESAIKTQTGMILGSPKYMSPEQVNGQPLDSRSDLFSLAVILYEMVTGAGPFNGNDLGQLMFNISHAEPVGPSQINHAIPKMLDLVIHKGLQKDPALRYQDGLEFAGDLEACLAGLGAAARLPPGAGRDDSITATLPNLPRAVDGYATTMLNLGSTGSRFATTVKTPAQHAVAQNENTLPLAAHRAGQTTQTTQTTQASPAAPATQAIRTVPLAQTARAAPAAALPTPERRTLTSGARLSLSHQFNCAQALTALDAPYGKDATSSSTTRVGPRDLRRLMWLGAYTLATVCAVLIVFF